jgi:hypothetical protein
MLGYLVFAARCDSERTSRPERGPHSQKLFANPTCINFQQKENISMSKNSFSQQIPIIIPFYINFSRSIVEIRDIIVNAYGN